MSKIKNLKTFSEDPDLAFFDELQETNDLLEKVSQTLEGVDLRKLDSLKGDKGEKGDSIIGPMGPKGEKGSDGKDGKNGKDGYTPVKDKDYFDGKDGADGLDGSPDTAEDIRNKLELLSGDERLDAKYIKNIPEEIDATKVRDLLESLEGDERLSYKSLSDTPDIDKKIQQAMSGMPRGGSGVKSLSQLEGVVGVTALIASPTEPVNPSVGTLWVDTS